MEREIWEIVKALDENKLTEIEAHKKLCDLYIIIKSSCYKECGNTLPSGSKDNICLNCGSSIKNTR